MTTARDRAITELMLAKEFIDAAALTLSVDLVSSASVEGAKARDAITQALSEIENAIAGADCPSKDYRAERLTQLPC